MKLTWKRDPHPTGLASVGAGPRGSKLHDGEKTYATTSAIGGSWRGPLRGWYWVAGWDGDFPSFNSYQTPLATEDEAKKAARAYVVKHLSEPIKERK